MKRPERHHRHARQRGLSLVELMLALTITAVLLTATMVATNASIRAYSSAAEQASTQATTRLIVHRLLGLVRTSTAHGPLLPNPSGTPPVTQVDALTVSSSYFELVDPNGNVIRVEFNATDGTLNYTRTPLGGGTAVTQPMLAGVTNATFTINRRLDDDGIWVLNRLTLDITVQPDDDATMSMEQRGPQDPIRMVASTMPRKLQ